MKRRVIGYFAVIVVGLAIALPFVWMANERRLKRKYENALARIEIGDSEQTVVALMGQPDFRDWCYPLRKDNDSEETKRFHEQCYITFTYSTFMEHYGVSFDKNNRVSGTFRSVSP
jgi:hypothetical protein